MCFVKYFAIRRAKITKTKRPKIISDQSLSESGGTNYKSVKVSWNPSSDVSRQCIFDVKQILLSSGSFIKVVQGSQ